MGKTFEEFVQMTAMIHATGKDYERMYSHFGIDEATWQKIAMHWMEQIGNDVELRHRFQAMMAEETERQRAAAV
jgi:hypothetical protein